MKAYKGVELEAQKACDAAIKRVLTGCEEREQKAAKAYQKEREEVAKLRGPAYSQRKTNTSICC